MNLRNTVEIELEGALKRHVAVLLDSALAEQIDDNGLMSLINNLRAVDAIYKAIEARLDDL